MRTHHHLYSAQTGLCYSGFCSVLPHFSVGLIFLTLKCNIKLKKATFRLNFIHQGIHPNYGQNIKPDLNPLRVQMFFALHRAWLPGKRI